MVNSKALITLVVLLFSYSILLTVGLTIIITNPSLVFQNFVQNNESTEQFSITVLFESGDVNNPITWDPVIIKTNQSKTLLEALNSSLQIKGNSYGALGFFITEINGISQYSNYYWQIFIFNDKNEWIYSSKGASNIYIEKTSFFKLSFDD